MVAGGWIVADLDTGDVLGASNPHGKFGPASTLKILTALVMLPLIPPTQQIVATSEAVNVDGSKVGVVPNHTYTADMLFTAMLSVSGNDATRVLTSALGGDDAVLALMNAKAAQLQANDTVAKTVTGLDGPGQSTSAYDLALIARAALDLPSFRKYIAVPTAQFAGVDVPGFQITNHNLLLGHYPGTFGVKNGYTDASRATYVGAATQNGHSLMVSMVRTDPNYRNAAESLLNWGFAADGKVAPVGEAGRAEGRDADADLRPRRRPPGRDGARRHQRAAGEDGAQRPGVRRDRRGRSARRAVLLSTPADPATAEYRRRLRLPAT